MSKIKNILITGASRGLGLQIANDLKEHNLLLVARDCSKINIKAKVIELDLMIENSTSNLYKKSLEKEFIPDVIIHCVGGVIKGDSHPINTDILRKSMRFNLEIAIEINNYFLPHMIKKGEGKLIHISSDASLTGNASPSYVTSKSALNTYTKNLARFYAKSNIMVSTVLPGIFEFEGSDWSKKRLNEVEKYKHRVSQVPIGRFGSVEEVSEMIKHLSLSKSMMYTGSLITINGGI